MKKTPLLRSIVLVGCSVVSMGLFSCKKETVSTPQLVTVQKSPALSEASGISTAISPSGVLGKYYDRGSRTLYRGKAGVDNAIMSLDYYNYKRVVALADEKALACGYGETSFVRKGWEYRIRYNVQKGEITLAPNDVMAAAIQPNSFKTLAATYDETTGTFNFLTRFIDMDGNENEVFDIMTKL